MTSIPSDLFYNCSEATDFISTFEDCVNLRNIPANLFENCTKVRHFVSTFAGCDGLEGNSIPLWERVEDGEQNEYIGLPYGMGCYFQCENLTDYSSIPNYWKEEAQESD